MIFTTFSCPIHKQSRREAQERTILKDTSRRVRGHGPGMMSGRQEAMDLSECPVKVTAEVISGKWKPLILFSLKGGALRYGELRRQVPGPTHKVLTQQLRQLERDKIIRRKIYAQVP